jgi:hypothetical protein
LRGYWKSREVVVKYFDRDDGKMRWRWDGEMRRKWERTRKAKLARIMRGVPQTLNVDLLTLTVCFRYAESLLKNPRVKKYLLKHHPEELSDLETLLAELNGVLGVVWQVYSRRV